MHSKLSRILALNETITKAQEELKRLLGEEVISPSPRRPYGKRKGIKLTPDTKLILRQLLLSNPAITGKEAQDYLKQSGHKIRLASVSAFIRMNNRPKTL